MSEASIWYATHGTFFLIMAPRMHCTDRDWKNLGHSMVWAESWSALHKLILVTSRESQILEVIYIFSIKCSSHFHSWFKVSRKIKATELVEKKP